MGNNIMQNIVKVDFQNRQLVDEIAYASSSTEYSVFKVMREAVTAEKERIIKDYLSE